MPLLPTKTTLRAVLCCSAAVFAVSCVNEDYDLSKEIDKKINISGDFSAPLGDSELIQIGEFLNLDKDDQDVLKTDANGNYYVQVIGNGSATGFYVPSVAIDDALVTDGGFRASVDRNDIVNKFFAGTTLPYDRIPIPSGVKYSQEFVATETPIKVDQEVDPTVLDIQSVMASAVARVSISINAGKATISGLSLKFPEYLQMGSVTGNDCTFDSKTNILSFNSMAVNTTKRVITLAVNGVDFTKMPKGQGFDAARHKIFVDDAIKLSKFTTDLTLSDFGTTVADLPEKAHIDIVVDVPALTIKEATIKVDPKVDLDAQMVNVGTLPDFVNGDGVVLDLYDPMILFNVVNNSPVALTLNADIVSRKGAKKETVHVGSAGSKPTDEILIGANGRTGIFVSSIGKNAPEGSVNVKVPGLSDIMKIVPAQVGLDNIDVKAVDEFVTVSAGATYRFAYDYEVKAPLAFGGELSLEYDTDFDGWNETFNPKDDKKSDKDKKKDFDLNVEDADVTFDFVNMIPLNLVVTAQAIDVDGKVLPGVTVTLSGDVPAGSVEKPGRKALTLNMKASAENMRRLDGIRMHLKATSKDSQYQGICLNKNQGVRLENMKLRFLGNVDVEL